MHRGVFLRIEGQKYNYLSNLPKIKKKHAFG